MAKKTKKQKLRSKADQLWFEVCILKYGAICILCGHHHKKKVIQSHHFYPKGLYNIVRYDLDNGVPLCKGCHFRHHHLGDTLIHLEIIIKKGKRWLNRLTKKARVRKSSFMTVKWYENHIARLEKIKVKLLKTPK